jgi:DNA-binding NarL/FixJ family response regulator
MAALAAREGSRAVRVALMVEGGFLRRGLHALLARDSRTELLDDAADRVAGLGAGASASDGLAGWSVGGFAAAGGEPDVVVAHTMHADASAGEMIDRLRERFDSVAIVALVMADDPLVTERLLDAGARGVVLMDGADAELVDAVVAAAAGETYTSPAIAARLEALRNALRDERLSAREMEVLWLIARGFTSSEIAAQLGLSTRTIEAHRARIARKLGAKSRADLVRYALDRHLLRV